jgi:hypothetical protein
VPAVIGAIAKMISHAVAEERILPAAATLGAIAENTAISLRHNLRSIEAKLAEPERAPVALFRDQAGATILQLENLLTHIEDQLETADRELREAVGADLRRLGEFLHYRAWQFAESQGEHLVKLGMGPALRASFQEESFALRSRCAEEFYKYVTDIAKQLLARQRDTETALRKAAATTLPEINALHFGFQSTSFSPPSIIALSRTTAFDLEDFWSPQRAREPSAGEELTRFKDLIKGEYGAMIEELLRGADQALRDHVAGALRRLRFLSYSAIYPIAQQLQHFAEALQEQDSAAPALAELIAAGEAELQHGRTLSQGLQALRRECSEMLDR